MDFADEAPRPRGESAVPMINVVFLLLIFFLITAQFAPRAPFPVEPPAARADRAPEGGVAIWLAADGRIAFRGLVAAEAVAAAAAAARAAGGPVLVRADRSSAGRALAALLASLAAAGAETAQVVVVPR